MPYDVTGQWYPSGGVPSIAPGGIPEAIRATGAYRPPTAAMERAAGGRPTYWAGVEAGHEFMDAGAEPYGLPPGGAVPGGYPTLEDYYATLSGGSAYSPVGFDGIAEPGAETFNGIAAPLAPGVTPVVAPIIAGAAALIARFMSLGAIKALLAKFGPTILKALVGGAVFATIMKLIGGGASDETIVDMQRKRKRRYTIGRNPRVQTLAKVSRHCQRLLKRHEKVIREFLPKKTVKYGIPPSRALSAIERAAIKG